MEVDDLINLLRELPTEQTAKVVAEMAPDEAAEALRELDPETRDELLEAMDPDRRRRAGRCCWATPRSRPAAP